MRLHPLTKAVLAGIDDAGWTIHEPPGPEAPGTVTMTFDGDASTYEVEVHSGDPLVYCYVMLPMRVPDARIAAVAELITRANWELRSGNFDLNWENGGDLQFRTSINVCDGQLTSHMVQRLVLDGVEAADRFHDAFIQVVFGNVDPGRAFSIAMYGDDDADERPERG
jgi:hypothetical protein